MQAFYSETYECKMGFEGMACNAMLSLDDATECKNNCNELSSAELDLLSLGITLSSLSCNKTSFSRGVEENCQSTRMCFLNPEREFGKKPYFCTVFNRTSFTASLALQEDWIDLVLQ